jgi:hypothetical protein
MQEILDYDLARENKSICDRKEKFDTNVTNRNVKENK